MTQDAGGQDILSVSELTRRIRTDLESSFAGVWVSGEISNFKLWQQSFVFFDLKDENAVLPVVLETFKARTVNLVSTFGLKSPSDTASAAVVNEKINGRKVRVFGQVSIHQKSGRYQIRISRIELEGQGELQARFEELKIKLEKKGYFDQGRKRAIPAFPAVIGVVTSPTGAVIRDILNITSRRWDSLDIVLYPALVQGARAAEDIARGIEVFNHYKNVDVIIVGRGGGSLEDLWAFNEEAVADAIFKSRIPVISAVGHEVDFTIADFVADLRAPTPSAAAELVTNRTKENTAELVLGLGTKLEQRLRDRVARHKELLTQLSRNRLKKDLVQTLDFYAEKLEKHLTRERLVRELGDLTVQHAERLDTAREDLLGGLKDRVRDLKERFNGSLGKLNLLDPLGILKRGYSVTYAADGRILFDAASAAEGGTVRTVLSKGELISRVEEKK